MEIWNRFLNLDWNEVHLVVYNLVLFALKQFEKIKLGFYLINFSDCIILRMKKYIYKRYLEYFSVFGFHYRCK